jgi:hypothetical protein
LFRFLAQTKPRQIQMRYLIPAVVFLSALTGCTSVPNGPSVAVMPAPGKPFDLFVAEDRECRKFAQQSIGKSASEAGTDSEVKSMAAGTAIGAVAGAVIGGGHNGAGTGAAIGLLSGASIGSNEARYSEREAQRRYDISYEQCMYAKGNQLPGSSGYRPRARYVPPPAQPAPAYNPPPPPPPSVQ